MAIKKELSATLMVANLFATVLVIGIHYRSHQWLEAANQSLWNGFAQEFVVNGLARCAVPFFAMLSGFFLWDNLQQRSSYMPMLRRKAKTLLLPYLVVSLGICIFSLASKAALNPGAFHPEISSFFYDVVLRPRSVQFWFLRDLVFLTLLSPVLIAGHRYFSYALALALSGLWLLDIQPLPLLGEWYWINVETLFFFCAGGVLARHTGLLSALAETAMAVKTVTLLLWCALIALRIHLDPTLDVWYVRNYSLLSILLYKAAILVGILALVQWSSVFSGNRALIYISGLTFFAYLFHLVPFYYAVRFCADRVLDAPYDFYLSFPIAVVAIFFLAHLVSKFCPAAYAFLTGGRNPGKALNRTYSVQPG